MIEEIQHSDLEEFYLFINKYTKYSIDRLENTLEIVNMYETDNNLYKEIVHIINIIDN